MIKTVIRKKCPPQTYAAISENLRLLRIHKGISRNIAAYNANVSLSTLLRLETEDCAKVTVWRLLEVCAYYQIDPPTVLIKGYYANKKNLPKQ